MEKPIGQHLLIPKALQPRLLFVFWEGRAWPAGDAQNPVKQHAFPPRQEYFQAGEEGAPLVLLTHTGHDQGLVQSYERYGKDARWYAQLCIIMTNK